MLGNRWCIVTDRHPLPVKAGLTYLDAVCLLGERMARGIVWGKETIIHQREWFRGKS